MYLRVAGLLFFALYFFHAGTYPDGSHLIDFVNLVIHEAGHTILFFLGEFMQVAAGSLFQILIPIVFSTYFFLRRDFFSGSLLLMWVGQNIISVGIYAADGLVMQLPLLGGDSVIHDWNYLLSHVGLLRYAASIGHGIIEIGWVVMVLGAAGAAFAITQNRVERISVVAE